MVAVELGNIHTGSAAEGSGHLQQLPGSGMHQQDGTRVEQRLRKAQSRILPALLRWVPSLSASSCCKKENEREGLSLKDKQ